MNYKRNLRKSILGNFFFSFSVNKIENNRKKYTFAGLNNIKNHKQPFFSKKTLKNLNFFEEYDFYNSKNYSNKSKKSIVKII